MHPPICFLIPLPPRSSLFPYTTLFRSLCPRVVCADEVGRSSAEYTVHQFLMLRRSVSPLPSTGELPSVLDRKSTRLNSSHITISYAVFCLKKKTKLDLFRVTISYAVTV